jgi:hypothetical protein
MNDQILTKRVELKPFPVKFIFIGYSNDDAFLSFCVNEGIKIDENSKCEDVNYVFIKGPDVYIVFYLPALDNIGVIAHEAIHAVDKMFQILGQPEQRIDNDELFPYYTQFLVNEAITLLTENEILSLTFNNQDNEK